MKGSECGRRKGRPDVQGSRSHNASGGLDQNQLQRPRCPGLFKPGPRSARRRAAPARVTHGFRKHGRFCEDEPPLYFLAFRQSRRAVGERLQLRQCLRSFNAGFYRDGPGLALSEEGGGTRNALVDGPAVRKH
ncbi:hypothetical protein SKAU_G00084930 [Synaphobranchus kaupii]|uniref:Uncharacterized protein n=1 Tax=Synaphobranchus kaupii TaxID=118154 RepID=A0A9Q1FVJ7_SYNKA|nr:hypothetical protein SKAU_G00084930 [Synaphobranchus kaupii]